MVSLSDLFEQSIHYEPGEVITREGDENRDLYILSQGTLEISIKGDDGQVEHQHGHSCACDV